MLALDNANGPYPPGAIPITSSSGNKANAIGTSTLTSPANKTTYITGLAITGSGATAGLPVTVTVTGTLGGTLSYTYTYSVGALVPNQPLVLNFGPGVPAADKTTDIVVTCPASGAGGTNNTVVATGYYI
jgi:hypothetical protein